MTRTPTIIGVRHFSPACARLVVQRIHALRPAHVLIEGPADFNGRFAELALPHQLPLALYSYHNRGGADPVRRASWSPFSLNAPEWQAIEAGREAGARLRFIDLPAWDHAFDDASERDDSYQQALCSALSIDGSDALWDHLFEGELEADELAARLDTHFANLRANDPGSPGNHARETMMARHIAWAMAQDDGPVVVVCGGYHAPALAALWPAMETADPEVALPLAGEFGTYLVPYHFKRLDALAGYASGMSSPAYYEWVWTLGVAGAGTELLRSVLARLREKKLAASTADFIAIHTHAQGLARMRGHADPLRCDWLDALAGSLVKQAMDAPLPWTYRGLVRAGTDPALVQVMDVLAGHARGQLAPGTPQPPLVDAVDAELAALGITRRGRVTLSLLDAADRPRSRALHRLALLDIPGVLRTEGPDLALGSGQQEVWLMDEPLEQRAALIEAASYGASLYDAARSRLEEQLRNGPDTLSTVAEGLNRAAFAGLDDFSARLLERIDDVIAREPHFHALGKPLQVLHALLRHGAAMGIDSGAVLHTAIGAAFDRALWLAEAPGSVAPQDHGAHINTYRALDALIRDSAGLLSAPEAARALAVCRRKAAAEDAPPLSRGAALGLLVSRRALPDAALASALLASLAPGQLGDALAGMLALAREQLCHDSAFVAALDAKVRDFDDADFVLALPAMRGAFTWLPTQERGQLAAAVLTLHKGSGVSARRLTGGLALPAEALAHNALRERAALARLAAWGIAL